MNSNSKTIPDNHTPVRRSTHRKGKRTTADWLVPLLLILLSTVPVIAGSVRLIELSSGANITAENARFFASPIPVVLHIISVTFYSMLGALQFSRGFRHRQPKWHRTLGWFLTPSGFVAALSGLWMTHFYPWPAYDGISLYGLRLVFGIGMVIALVLASLAIRQRNYAQHGAWMMRAYAIGMGAGTQVFTHLPWFLFPSIQSELARSLCMAAGWLINLAIAEWLIYKRLSRPKRAPDKLARS
ncbi:MAG: DUF2306 domain-containing protein [Anaerolineales bacterium]|nr:DUF2306 domain-containing protein [Anaerolineales bacterium]